VAKAKRRTTAAADAQSSVSSSERIARLLALLVVKDLDTDEAALKLDAAGFGAGDIARMLDVNPNYLNVAKYRQKRSIKKSKKG
jgi:hypothetical protein